MRRNTANEMRRAVRKHKKNTSVELQRLTNLANNIALGKSNKLLSSEKKDIKSISQEEVDELVILMLTQSGSKDDKDAKKLIKKETEFYNNHLSAKGFGGVKGPEGLKKYLLEEAQTLVASAPTRNYREQISMVDQDNWDN